MYDQTCELTWSILVYQKLGNPEASQKLADLIKITRTCFNFNQLCGGLSLGE